MQDFNIGKTNQQTPSSAKGERSGASSDVCNSAAEVQAAINLAKTKKDQDHIFFQATISICPTCLKHVTGQILMKDGKVWMHKFCPEHGDFEVLLADDAKWWLRSLTQTKPGTIPLAHATHRRTQCPQDCGLCDDHQQHTCFPLIEITDRCDLKCPICFAENQQKWDISVEQLRGCLDQLGKAEGRSEIVTFTGGEPTLHPRFWELLELASNHPAADRVAVNTHGLKFAKDEEFCRRFAGTNAVVQLQFDGFSPETYRRLRGTDLSGMKRRALENLAKYNIITTLITTVGTGLNEDAVGEAVKLTLQTNNIGALTLQPVVYCGDARRNELMHDFRTHMTSTALLGLVEAQMDGAITKDDFVSIPCSHPSCSAVGYFLSTGDGEWVSLAKVTNADKMLDYLANRLLIRADELMADLKTSLPHLEALWSASAVPGSPKVKKAISCCTAAYAKSKAIIGTGTGKMIAVHGFMDASTYDEARAMKCCVHFLTRDGRAMPFCNYNIFHRHDDMIARAAGK